MHSSNKQNRARPRLWKWIVLNNQIKQSGALHEIWEFQRFSTSRFNDFFMYVNLFNFLQQDQNLKLQPVKWTSCGSGVKVFPLIWTDLISRYVKSDKSLDRQGTWSLSWPLLSSKQGRILGQREKISFLWSRFDVTKNWYSLVIYICAADCVVGIFIEWIMDVKLCRQVDENHVIEQYSPCQSHADVVNFRPTCALFVACFCPGPSRLD